MQGMGISLAILMYRYTWPTPGLRLRRGGGGLKGGVKSGCKSGYWWWQAVLAAVLGVAKQFDGIGALREVFGAELTEIPRRCWGITPTSRAGPSPYGVLCAIFSQPHANTTAAMGSTLANRGSVGSTFDFATVTRRVRLRLDARALEPEPTLDVLPRREVPETRLRRRLSAPPPATFQWLAMRVSPRSVSTVAAELKVSLKESAKELLLCSVRPSRSRLVPGGGRESAVAWVRSLLMPLEALPVPALFTVPGGLPALARVAGPLPAWVPESVVWTAVWTVSGLNGFASVQIVPPPPEMVPGPMPEPLPALCTVPGLDSMPIILPGAVPWPEAAPVKGPVASDQVPGAVEPPEPCPCQVPGAVPTPEPCPEPCHVPGAVLPPVPCHVDGAVPAPEPCPCHVLGAVLSSEPCKVPGAVPPPALCSVPGAVPPPALCSVPGAVPPPALCSVLGAVPPTVPCHVPGAVPAPAPGAKEDPIDVKVCATSPRPPPVCRVEGAIDPMA